MESNQRNNSKGTKKKNFKRNYIFSAYYLYTDVVLLLRTLTQRKINYFYSPPLPSVDRGTGKLLQKSPKKNCWWDAEGIYGRVNSKKKYGKKILLI